MIVADRRFINTRSSHFVENAHRYSHLYSAFCKSIEGVFRTILFIPLPELTHATERTYIDPADHSTYI